MKVVGLCGVSGSGKTSLGTALIAALKARGQRVSVLKHAHKRFDIDHPGKDSWRHREAGAFEVLVANDHRLALVREYEAPTPVDVQALLCELADLGDDHWVLVEGFKHADLTKIEVWRSALGSPALYPDDPYVLAIVSDDVLPVPTALPCFGCDAAPALADWLLAGSARFEWMRPD